MTGYGFQEYRLPYLTAETRGTGGALKRFDEDFFVEEIPLYPASGEGTHVYFTIEKRGLTTLAAINLIARDLGRRPHEIGYAGLKDAHGITRQRFSLEHVEPDRVAALDLGRVRVLSVERHGNKIKLGHLAGNRFRIRIRDVAPDAHERAEAVFKILSRRGVPNYFGPQRFGARGDNAAVGRAVLREDYDTALALLLGRPTERDHGDALEARKQFDSGNVQGAAKLWARVSPENARVCRALGPTSGRNVREAWSAVHRTLRRLYVSAVQSELFNRVLNARIAGIDHLDDGDLAWKHANGACFRVLDAAQEQPRCDAFEISPTGPLFGRRMTEAQGCPGEIEQRVLAESGLGPEHLRSSAAGRLKGARRPLRVPLTHETVTVGKDERGRYLELAFVLPPGAYATSVLREVRKIE